jgi:uncharacterized membrane protein YcaP (DUF421 family)
VRDNGIAQIGVLVSKTVLVYLFVLFAMRLMGKREIGKLSVFDLVVSIMIAEVAAVSLDLEEPLWKGIVIVLILVAMQVVVAFLSLKSHRLREFLEGRPTIIIRNGRIDDQEMRKTRYSMSDLLTQLREKNIANVGDVEFAILETSGKLSVFPKAETRPITREDLGIDVPRFAMPVALIVDGKPLAKNLKQINKDETWLQEQIRYYGYEDPKQVFFCSIDHKGQLFFDSKDQG